MHLYVYIYILRYIYGCVCVSIYAMFLCISIWYV